MNKIETYKGIEIFAKKDLIGGTYYVAPKMTKNVAPVNFAPTLRMMKQLIDDEQPTKQ